METSSPIRSVLRVGALALLVIFMTGMGFSSLSEKSEEPFSGVHLVLYNSFMERLVADIYDLETFFTDQQNRYVPINPPFVDFILFQKSSPPTIPFDPKGFPKSFTDQLIPRMENSVPVYGVWIEEHPISRDILFYNQDRTLLHQLPRPAGDEPHAYLYALKPDLYSGHYSTPEIDRWLRIYDPARIQIFVQLLHVAEVEPYLYVEEILNRQTGEDGGDMMMMESGSDDIAFIFMKPTNSIAFTLNLPEDMTNQVDIYTSTDLLPGSWSLAATNLPHPGTNLLYWIDTHEWLESGSPVRFYAAGDAQTDSDGDGLPDAREIMLYGTDPNNPNDHPNIKGTISYSGQQNNSIIVLAVEDSNSWSLAHSTAIPTTGSYQIYHAPTGAYHVKAFRDMNGNGWPDPEEAVGVYINNPVVVTGQMTGINIHLIEPDGDGDGVSDYIERTVFRTNPHDPTDIPPQLDRLSKTCYYGHGSVNTNWRYAESTAGMTKSYSVGRGWVDNGIFLPDLSDPSYLIYFGEALGSGSHGSGGWVYSQSLLMDSYVAMGSGYIWADRFLTDHTVPATTVRYLQPNPSDYPDLFVYSHSLKSGVDDMGRGWVRHGSFTADMSQPFATIYQGLARPHSTSTNMTRRHTLPASHTSQHYKGDLGDGWATPAGFIPRMSVASGPSYYYGALKNAQGVSGYSTISSDFVTGTYMALGNGFLAGGDFIPSPGYGEPPISAYDQDGDGFLDIPMDADGQFAPIDDSEFLQLSVTIGDASGSHTEMYGYTIGSFKYDMPLVNPDEYLFTSVVPLKRGQTYSGQLRNLPDEDPDGDYTFLLGGSLDGPLTNVTYVNPSEPGVIVQANFPHSGAQDTNLLGYVNDSDFNSGTKNFTLHVPRVNIRAHRAGPIHAPGLEVTRFHEHLPNAILLPGRPQPAPSTLTTNDGSVSTLTLDRFLPTGVTTGYLRISSSNPDVLTLYDHNKKRVDSLQYNVATTSTTNPLYWLKSNSRTWYALGVSNGAASVTLSYGLTTNSTLCSDTIQFRTLSVVSVDVHSSDPETHKIESVLPDGMDHFVCVKDTGDIVLNATILPDDSTILDQVTWEADGATITYPAVGNDKRTAKLSSTAANKIPIRIKVAGITLWEGVVWVVWADLSADYSTSTTSLHPNNERNFSDLSHIINITHLGLGVEPGDPWNLNRLFYAGIEWRCVISPAEIISDDEIPDLTAEISEDGADHLWDVTRDLQRRIWSDGTLVISSTGWEWDDDGIGGQIDEDNNPYNGPRDNPSGEPTGELFSLDTPAYNANRATLDIQYGGWGATENLIAKRIFRESVRLKLGNTWYRCSDYMPWRAYISIEKTDEDQFGNPKWEIDPSSPNVVDNTHADWN